jgi:hypothetical protein
MGSIERFAHEDRPSLDAIRPITDGDVLDGSPNL